MFAPNHEQTAREMLRVARPGGTIGLASWTPDGFLGDLLFRTVAEFVPPPAVASPMLWGTGEHLRIDFGPQVEWVHATTWFTFRFPSANAFVDYFAENYGPTLTKRLQPPATALTLRSQLTTLVRNANRLDAGGPVAVPATYLLSRGTVHER